MEKNMVGYRFKPTGEELINHYLKNKILGHSWLIDEAISEINICDYEPELLPSLSKLESKDLVWYFFSRKVYTSANKKVIKRSTPFGFWKATGVDRKIRDRRGYGVEIGNKKTLVYYKGRTPNGVRTHWVMHEHHITSLPHNQGNYVLCQVMYKGADEDILYGNNSNEPSNSMVSVSNTIRAINTSSSEIEDGMSVNDLNEQEGLSLFDGFSPDNNSYYHQVQLQTPCGDEYWTRLLNFEGGNMEEDLILMHEDYNDYRPMRPLTGIILDDDTDAESISAKSYGGTSSQSDSDGISWESHFTKCTIPSKQEVLRCSCVDASLDKKSKSLLVKKGWFVIEEAMQRDRKNPQYIYLVNMIIGFILLMAIIGNIVSVVLSLKTWTR